MAQSYRVKVMKSINQCTDENIAGITDDTPRKPETPLTVRFSRWRRQNVPDMLSLTILAIIIGMLCGVAAYAFKHLISFISGFFIPHIKDNSLNWWLLPLPVVGILLTGIFTRYIVKTNLTHGVAQLMHDIKNKKFKLRHNICFSPILGGSVTLGMGGSAGAEGPIAYTGAAIGSNLGQCLGLGDEMLKNLVGCGASAGIAAIFSAPVGGMMFGFELLRIKLSTNAILAVTTACLTAYLTIFTLNGLHVDLSFTPMADYDPASLPMVFALGVFCGLYCLYYNDISSRMDTYFRNLSNPWLRNIIGGLMIGVIVMIFPSMFSVGYPVIGNVINGDTAALARGCLFEAIGNKQWMLMITAAGILLCKCWAVSATTSSGGVAGDFAPTLFAGSMAGFLFASLCNTLFMTDLPIGVMGYLGMAGVMAGAIEAPLMTIFITMEMTQSYHFSLPLAICAITSYSTVKTFAWMFGHHHPLVTHHKWFSHRPAKPSPTEKES